MDKKIDDPVTHFEYKIDGIVDGLVRMQADLREIKKNMATKDDMSRILEAIASSQQRIARLESR